MNFLTTLYQIQNFSRGIGNLFNSLYFLSMFIRPPGDQPLRSVTLCRWSGVLLTSLLIAVPPEVQINTRKDRKRCSLLDDNSTATPDYDSAHANYTVNYMRQLQNHDYRHMTTIRLVTSPFYCTLH